MSYTYISQKFKEYDFWLRESRLLPQDLPYKLRKAILIIEEGYRRGDLDWRRAVILASIFKNRLGYKYRIISDKHIVIVPISKNELMRAFLQYPQIIAIIGNRHAGKTVTSWTIAIQAMQKLPDATLYVYGDVDGIGEQVMKLKPELGERIILKESYNLPPLDGKRKIVLYNELASPLLSKKAISNENVELNLQALRSRHLNTWIIYNVIRSGLLESTLRETADIKIFKWTTSELLENAMRYMPKGYSELLKICVKLNRNEGLVFAPVEGEGTKIFIHHTNPPEWLLMAHRRAKENTRLMMVKSERERYILQRIGELTEKGLKSSDIQIILQREGIELTKRSIQLKAKKWRKLVGLEEDKNNKKA